MARRSPTPIRSKFIPKTRCFDSIRIQDFDCGSEVKGVKNRDLFSSLFWMGFGILFLVGALQQGLMRKGIPGPGFVPFIVAVILISLSLMVFIPALGRKEKEGQPAGGENFFPEKDSLRKIALALIALFAYGMVLHTLGYILTAFLFMLFMSRLIESRSWIRMFILALLTAVVSYFLFLALEVQLPQGVLEILGI